MGEYKENLPSGGELVVTPDSWCISYYFPGPDMRYNGTFLRIPSTKVDKYIRAWKNNFEEYMKLKHEWKLGGVFEKLGEAE